MTHSGVKRESATQVATLNITIHKLLLGVEELKGSTHLLGVGIKIKTQVD